MNKCRRRRKPGIRQREVYCNWWEVGADRLRRWLMRRLVTILGGALDVGKVALCLRRVRLLYEVVPSCVALATLRVVGNAWPTSRRIGGTPHGCAFGCAAVGGGDARHCIACPCFPDIRAQRECARAICWANGGCTSNSPCSRRPCLESRWWSADCGCKWHTRSSATDVGGRGLKVRPSSP